MALDYWHALRWHISLGGIHKEQRGRSARYTITTILYSKLVFVTTYRNFCKVIDTSKNLAHRSGQYVSKLHVPWRERISFPGGPIYFHRLPFEQLRLRCGEDIESLIRLRTDLCGLEMRTGHENATPPFVPCWCWTCAWKIVFKLVLQFFIMLMRIGQM